MSGILHGVGPGFPLIGFFSLIDWCVFFISCLLSFAPTFCLSLLLLLPSNSGTAQSFHENGVGGARQVLISSEITLRHKELKIARLTLSCNRGKLLYFFKTSFLHLSNCQNRNWTNHHFSPICFIDIETLRRDNAESLNTAALGQH